MMPANRDSATSPEPETATSAADSSIVWMACFAPRGKDHNNSLNGWPPARQRAC